MHVMFHSMCIPVSWAEEQKISPSSITAIPYKNSDHFTHLLSPPSLTLDSLGQFTITIKQIIMTT